MLKDRHLRFEHIMVFKIVWIFFTQINILFSLTLKYNLYWYLKTCPVAIMRQGTTVKFCTWICYHIYRITAVMRVETDIITSIIARLIGWDLILGDTCNLCQDLQNWHIIFIVLHNCDCDMHNNNQSCVPVSFNVLHDCNWYMKNHNQRNVL